MCRVTKNIKFSEIYEVNYTNSIIIAHCFHLYCPRYNYVCIMLDAVGNASTERTLTMSRRQNKRFNNQLIICVDATNYN
jgi:hypothetical protein